MSENTEVAATKISLSVRMKKVGLDFLTWLRRSKYLKPVAEFLAKTYHKIFLRKFIKKWLVKTPNGSYFDFNGAKLPDISNNWKNIKTLSMVFEDTFFIPCCYDDNHDKTIVEEVDKFVREGPYGYTDGKFDVTVKSGDVVIDIGAWIGDFSAYAASKGATAYAFEPVQENYQLLSETAELNNKKIYPIQKGLSSSEGEVLMYVDGGSSSILAERSSNNAERETIIITTLDKIVKEFDIKRIDFIKADIEGAERDMLRGAVWTLKHFAPKLAICTYHLPDDPQVLEQIIKEANPDYTVKHTRHKLFAMVVK
ncbi:MAG: FkbM family methyltransferase [Campylobacteraceae bacterium]|jgi:FkbM family methyltransferase|nr:FkbM family methyltransferase [Campylobacteraceae bacterium]